MQVVIVAFKIYGLVTCIVRYVNKKRTVKIFLILIRVFKKKNRKIALKKEVIILITSFCACSLDQLQLVYKLQRV